MSTGGIFKLITNDGKQDKLLNATQLLNKRLFELTQKRARTPGIRDTTPTLVDIERTHILFMNAHFKPFAALGYEYGKVNAIGGTARLGNETQFSIPQFGDFFNDMLLHIKLGAVEAANADYWTDAAANPANGTELLRYVDFLGQRLVEKVKFSVNGNPLDEYDSDIQNFHEKMFVIENQKHGWRTMVGQENPKQGYKYVQSAGGRVGRGAGIRESKQILDGHQTAKPSHGEIELWIPLLFWFNKDPRLAVPSICIPYGQRYIDIKLAHQSNILQHLHAFDRTLDAPGSNPVIAPDVLKCELYINNIFVNPEIHDIYIKRIGFSLIRVHRKQSVRVTKNDDNLLLSLLKWPVETMYVGFRPADNVDTSSTKMLEDWHMYAQIIDTEVNECGVRDWAPTAAVFADAGAQMTLEEVDDGLGYTAGSRATFTFLSASGRVVPGAQNFFGATVSPTALLNAAVTFTANGQTLRGFQIIDYYLRANGFNGIDLTSALITDVQLVVATELAAVWPEPGAGGAGACSVRYKTCNPIIDTIQVDAHSIPLYQETPAEVFNHYIPYTYGGTHINTPKDCGAYMITFNLYPGSYQPSGHINASRAREFYLRYKSSVIGSSIAAADMILIGIAINFLLISDGSAILRYST